MSVASPPPPPPPPNSKYTVKGTPGTMCRYCAMQFDTEEELNTHVLTHTRGSAPLKCTMCGQTYRTSSKLQRHIRVHSGERPYTCHICGRRFSRSDHLKQHSKVHLHHRTKNTCRICNARFVGSHLLKAHLRSHGIKNVQTCTTCGEAFENSIELEKHKKLHEVKQNLCTRIRKKNNLLPEEMSNGNSEVSEESLDESKWMGCARFSLVQSNNKNNNNNSSNNNNDSTFETIENHENGWLEIIGKLVEADYAEQKARKELAAAAAAAASAATTAEENSSEANSNSDAVNQSSGEENQNLGNESCVGAVQNLTNKISSGILNRNPDKEYLSPILLGLHSEESSLNSNVVNQHLDTERNSDVNAEEWSCSERMEIMEASEDFSNGEPSSKNTAIRVCYSVVGNGEDVNGDEFGNIEAETITDGTKMFVVPSTSDYEENDQDGHISSSDLHNSLRNGEIISDDQGGSYTVSLVSKQPLATDQTNSTISNSRSEPFQIGNKKVSHCKHCGIWFEDFAICMLHNSLHLANDDPFTCKKCLKKLGNRLEFMAHLLWHLEPPQSTSAHSSSTCI